MVSHVFLQNNRLKWSLAMFLTLNAPEKQVGALSKYPNRVCTFLYTFTFGLRVGPLAGFPIPITKCSIIKLFSQHLLNLNIFQKSFKKKKKTSERYLKWICLFLKPELEPMALHWLTRGSTTELYTPGCSFVDKRYINWQTAQHWLWNHDGAKTSFKLRILLPQFCRYAFQVSVSTTG